MLHFDPILYRTIASCIRLAGHLFQGKKLYFVDGQGIICYTTYEYFLNLVVNKNVQFFELGHVEDKQHIVICRPDWENRNFKMFEEYIDLETI